MIHHPYTVSRLGDRWVIDELGIGMIGVFLTQKKAFKFLVKKVAAWRERKI